MIDGKTGKHPDKGDKQKPVEPQSGHEPVFLVLEAKTPAEGLKKASEILDLQCKELQYRIIDNINREVDGGLVEFLRIEFTRKPVHGASQIQISADKLSASIKVLYPKKPDGTEITYPYILSLVRKAKITYGLDKEVIKQAVKNALENYDILEDVEIAKGTPPVNEESNILQSTFPDKSEINYQAIAGLGLEELVSRDSVDRIRDNAFPAWIVQKGELLVLIAKPGRGKIGHDVLGKPILPQKGKLPFKAGDHVRAESVEDHVIYSAEISGYLECKDDTLRIHSPIWISPDKSEAYFLKLPLLNSLKKKLDPVEITEQLSAAGVVEGTITAEITAIPHRIEQDQPDFSAFKIAAGIPAEKGCAARIELFFDRDTRPGKLLNNGTMDYREIGKVKTVQKNQLLAVKFFPTRGKLGRDLMGNDIEAPKGDDIVLKALENVRVEMGKGKMLFYADLEGSVDMVGDTAIGVKPVLNIETDVNFSTGNISFNGDVNVKGSVVSGFKICAKGNITIAGMVNQKVQLEADGNIMIRKGIIGLAGVRDTMILSKGDVIANYIQGATIEAGGDVIVDDYIINSIVNTKGKAILPSPFAPSLMKGSIFGSEIYGTKGIEANSIGSEMSTRTTIIVGESPDLEIQLKKIQEALEYLENEYAQASKSLRIGISDVQNLKKRLEQIAPRDRLLYVDTLKRLKKIINTQSELKVKQQQLMEEEDRLAQQAEIIVKKVIYPRVNIQIGKLKKRTDSALSNLKLKMHGNGREIEFISL